MNRELQQEFWKAFPGIFRERTLPMTQTAMCWGLEIGDGWAELLWKLCCRILAFQRFHRCEVIAKQVKEKYGGLRFYWRIQFQRNDVLPGESLDCFLQMCRLTDRYEDESLHTCEECGRPGRCVSNAGWVLTRCDECLERSRIKR